MHPKTSPGWEKEKHHGVIKSSSGQTVMDCGDREGFSETFLKDKKDRH
jgi:hypothetical protein